MTSTTELLVTCLRHFKSVDESNAGIHLAKVKYSPITFALAEAMDPGNGYSYCPDAVEVLSHKGKYKVDKGR